MCIATCACWFICVSLSMYSLLPRRRTWTEWQDTSSTVAFHSCRRKCHQRGAEIWCVLFLLVWICRWVSSLVLARNAGLALAIGVFSRPGGRGPDHTPTKSQRIFAKNFFFKKGATCIHFWPTPPPGTKKISQSLPLGLGIPGHSLHNTLGQKRSASHKRQGPW